MDASTSISQTSAKNEVSGSNKSYTNGLSPIGMLEQKVYSGVYSNVFPVDSKDNKLSELAPFDGKNDKSRFQSTDRVTITNHFTSANADLKQMYNSKPSVTHLLQTDGTTIQFPSNISTHSPNAKVINSPLSANLTDKCNFPSNNSISNATPSKVISGTPTKIIINGTSNTIVAGTPTKIILTTPNRTNAPQSNTSVKSIKSVTPNLNIAGDVGSAQSPFLSNVPNFQSNEHTYTMPKPETVYLPPQRFIYDSKTGGYIPYNDNDPTLLNRIISPVNRTYTNIPTQVSTSIPTQIQNVLSPNLNGLPTQIYTNMPGQNHNTISTSFTTIPHGLTHVIPQSNCKDYPGTYTTIKVQPPVQNAHSSGNIGTGLANTVDFVGKMCTAPDQYITQDNRRGYDHQVKHYYDKVNYSNIYNSQYNIPSKYSPPYNPKQLYPQTKEALGFKFDKLERIPAAPQKASDICYSIVVYHENEELDSLFRTSKHLSYSTEYNFLNCDLQSEIVKIPTSSNEFIYMKVIEHFGHHESIVGRIKIKVSTLPSGHVLRVPIMGDDGLHKGCALFEFAPSRISVKELEALKATSMSYDQKVELNRLLNKQSGGRKKGKDTFPLSFIFGNFVKWCCDVSEL